jgi:hypothetical protein
VRQQLLVNRLSVEVDLKTVEETNNALGNSPEVTVAGIVEDCPVPPPELRIHGR